MGDGAKQLAFFGRITAGFTHDVKNVLAIIKESAGLMEDLLAVTPKGAFPHQERFSRAVATMLDQVRRGVSLSTQLNRFAHSVDAPLASIELNELIGQIVLLSQRFARLKGVALRAEPGEGRVVVNSSPIAVQMAIFEALECCWSALGNGGEILLSAGREAVGSASVFLCCRADPVPAGFWECVTASPSWGCTVELLHGLGASAEAQAAQSRVTLLFPVPCQ